MSEFEVEVVETRRKKPEGLMRRGVRRVGRAVRAVLIRPRLVVLSGVAVFLLTVGTPHVGFEYECGHPVRGPGTCRNVLWCAYYGVQGRRVEFPRDGESCSFVTLLPLDLNKLIGG